LTACEDELEVLSKSIRGQKGQVVKAEKMEALEVAVSEAMSLVQDEKFMGMDNKEKLKIGAGLVAKHPALAGIAIKNILKQTGLKL
jgi:hypothetical protein